MLLYTGAAPALLIFWKSQHRHLKYVLEKAETMLLLLPVVDKRNAHMIRCEHSLSVAEDKLLGGTAVAPGWLPSHLFRQAVLAQHVTISWIVSTKDGLSSL